MPTHAPKYLATYSESVSAFLSHPAPGYPGRDLPLGSYLSRRCLWGGRGTSQVRLPFTGTITMALKPPFPFLYHFPEISGPEASPRRRSLHGLSYPWVSGNHTAVTLLLHCLIWRRPGWATPPPRRRLALATPCLGDALPWRRLTLATPYLGDALSLSWRRFLLASLHLGDTLS